MNDPTNSSEVQLAATSKEEIFKSLIIPDLEFATENLPDKWDEAYTPVSYTHLKFDHRNLQWFTYSRTVLPEVIL